jgi:hypothetical protein
MHALYPELEGKGIMMTSFASFPFESGEEANYLQISISEVHPTEPIRNSSNPNPSSADEVGHLTTQFVFDARDRQVFSIMSFGSFVHSEKQQALTEQVDKHPDWSEAEMTRALSAAGAQFAPNRKEALLANIPFKKLEPLTGKIENQSIEFTFRINPEPPYVAVMDWSVRFRATKDGTRAEYTMSIEPFDGKVISFGRRQLD